MPGDAATARANLGITPDNIGAAPSGYGLGTSSGKDCSDFNTAIDIGWYWMTGGNVLNGPLENGSFKYGCLRVERRGAYITQTAIVNDILAMRGSNDGGATWGIWQHVNPGMQLGQEYPTTERYDGKPVYRKAIALGALPSAAVKRYGGVYGALSSSVPDWDTIVDLKLIIKSNDGSFGAAATYGGKKASIWAEKTQGQPNLVVDTDTWDATGFNGWAYMTYTKA